jgi:hypothetical protein
VSDSVIFRDFEQEGSALRIYDIWNFSKATNKVRHFGNIPPEIIDNLLYYFTDNSQKNAALKANIFTVTEIIPPDFSTLSSCSCHTGLQEYEPTTKEKESYCFADFRSCPRFETRLKK